MTRTTDYKGKTQPASIPCSENGYLFNQPVPHRVRSPSSHVGKGNGDVSDVATLKFILDEPDHRFSGCSS